MKRPLAVRAGRRCCSPSPPLTGCVAGLAVAGGPDAVNVVVGYQSKTINTVTAGTLLRAQGFFESGSRHHQRTGKKYKVSGRTTTPVRRSPRR